MGQYQGLNYAMRRLYQTRLNVFTQLLEQFKAGGAGSQQALLRAQTMLANTPNVLVDKNMSMIQLFMNKADHTLGAGSELETFLHGAANSIAQAQAKSASGMGGKVNSLFNKTQSLDYLHPAVESFEPGALTGQTFTSAEKMKLLQSLKGLDHQQALDKLKEIDVANFNAGTPTNLAQEFEAHLSDANAGGGLRASAEAIAEKGASQNEGLLSELMVKLGEKFPALSGFTGVLATMAKFLGPIAVILESKGLIDEYNEYGADNKFWCDFVSTLLGAASIITPFLGPAAVAEPFLAALWGVSSIGCMFVGRDKKSDKGNTNYTQSDINTREQNIKFQDLSQKDQQTVKSLMNEAGGDRTRIQSLASSAEQNHQFDSPLDVMAVLQKEVNKGGIIPSQ
jgi:hypothetical protein